MIWWVVAVVSYLTIGGLVAGCLQQTKWRNLKYTAYIWLLLPFGYYVSVITALLAKRLEPKPVVKSDPVYEVHPAGWDEPLRYKLDQGNPLKLELAAPFEHHVSGKHLWVRPYPHPMEVKPGMYVMCQVDGREQLGVLTNVHATRAVVTVKLQDREVRISRNFVHGLVDEP